MNRIFIVSKDTDEIEWMQEELQDIGRVAKAIDSLDFFIPQWESTETEIVIFMNAVVESESSFVKLVERIRKERPSTVIIFIYLPDNEVLLEKLAPYSVSCISYLELEPGKIEANIRGFSNYSQLLPDNSVLNPDNNNEDFDNREQDDTESEEDDYEEDHESFDQQDTTCQEVEQEGHIKNKKLFENIEKKKNAFLERKQQTALQRIQPEMDMGSFKSFEKKMMNKPIFHGGTVIIAIAGVERGVGVTHTSISIANYLASEKHRVALVEAGNANDFIEIEAAYEGVKDTRLLSDTTSFNLNGVRYFKSNSNVSIVELVTSDFAYVILDIGYYEDSEWFSEFLRANIQIAVGSGSDWKHKDIIKFLDNQIHIDQTKWRICLPMVSNQSMKDIKARLPKRKMYRLPYNPDPYDLDNESKGALEGLIMLNRQRKLSSIMKKIQSIIN